jgi:hypothetical protein
MTAKPSYLRFGIVDNRMNALMILFSYHAHPHLLIVTLELSTQSASRHDYNDHQSNTSGFALPILRTCLSLVLRATAAVRHWSINNPFFTAHCGWQHSSMLGLARKCAHVVR